MPHHHQPDAPVRDNDDEVPEVDALSRGDDDEVPELDATSHGDDDEVTHLVSASKYATAASCARFPPGDRLIVAYDVNFRLKNPYQYTSSSCKKPCAASVPKLHADSDALGASHLPPASLTHGEYHNTQYQYILGQNNGEVVERNWALLNPFTATAKQMGPGRRTPGVWEKAKLSTPLDQPWQPVPDAGEDHYEERTLESGHLLCRKIQNWYRAHRRNGAEIVAS
ncbi:hypothetical protein C8R43DRAFT_953668 [Mycena crocata]|nr:hypothetical protein C8R43DRAFT_953668 [Mycena crocata]